MALQIPSLVHESGLTLTGVYGRTNTIDLNIRASEGHMTLDVHPSQGEWQKLPLARFELFLGQEISPGVTVPTLEEFLQTPFPSPVTCATVGDAYAALASVLDELWKRHPALSGATSI